MPPRRSARAAAAAAAAPTPTPPPVPAPGPKQRAAIKTSKNKAPTPTPSPSLPPTKNVLLLKGCRIVVGLPGKLGTDLEEQVAKLGAQTSKNVTKTVTHLIANTADITAGSAKVDRANKLGIPIVDQRWVEACEDEGEQVETDKYVELAAGTGAANGAANGTVNSAINGSAPAKGKKRAAESDDEDTKPAKRGKAVSKPAAKPASASPSKAAGAAASAKLQGKADKAASKGESDGQKAKKTKGFNVPIDEYCNLVTYKVYIDDDGIIYDANLNQTNAGNNNNKFYRVQLLHNGNTYKTWTRWGRVGEMGQNALLGNGTLPDALVNFNKKFKDKSGLNWAQRNDAPKNKKYTFIEKSYEDDSDDEAVDNVKEEDDDEEWVPPESKLEQPIQDLMALIFNAKYMNAAMADLNYDANKMPLGKLSKSTILKGFQALKDLASLFDDHSLAQSVYAMAYGPAVEMLSNRFYSYIPHDFGRNRPPIISNEPMLKKEIDLLESLGDMKEAAAIMKAERPKDTMHTFDRQFSSLGMEEMSVLDKESTEFKELAAYLVNSKGATHNVDYKVEEIFRIERAGEKKRFDESIYSTIPSDRRLLWHGSRATNFGGILSQGLRIAPPEAPVSGYMFGKGIYLADMSSKSVNYCCSYLSDRTALLLLCEAELGDPLQTLTDASYTAGDTAKAGGMYSTWGQGKVGPSKWKCAGDAHGSLKGIKMPDVTTAPGDTKVPNAYLMYNEYITYDINQVKLRYLFRVKT
ncbi:hypothetical protein CspeluHIS016_0402570 [Cutaneotrichosporon spelunceum]|uniref:Poly [ADP-ribose] polymerase n=1 Tax=Cutaneotrichosporon spelunceum TaxID=1672016 RepID=A0AAD3TVJ3_9TREE|nr:hypothetical protein CspeluHIS016_0402570 [Cutaneotrichosporon spelunceum]